MNGGASNFFPIHFKRTQELTKISSTFNTNLNVQIFWKPMDWITDSYFVVACWWFRIGGFAISNLQQTSRKCIWIFWDMASRVCWAFFVELQLLKFTSPSVKTRYKSNFSTSELFQICKFSDRLSGKKNLEKILQSKSRRPWCKTQVDVGANSHGVVGAGGDPPPDITDFGSWRSG